MKRYYLVLLLVIIVVVISYFLVQNLKIGDVVREAIIKEVIPRELSKALSIPWKRISIIKSEKIKKGWECYFFTLSSKEDKEFFIAMVFEPSEKIEGQIDYFTEGKNISLIYLQRLTGFKEAHIEGCEIVSFQGCEVVHLVNLGFLVLRLKNVQINGKPFKEYLKYL